MIDNLRAIAIFAETILQGSFRGAARELKLSPSVVSYHITQLEHHLGTALIYRSTRKLSLTHQGDVLYQHALKMLASAKQGLSEVAAGDDNLIGELRITLPSALIPSPVARQIAEFSKKHPGIKLHVIFSDENQDLIAGRIALAIRAGELKDSSMKSRRIGQVERKLVCSPDYWKQQREPEHPEDLTSWNWVKLDMLQNQRTLRHKNHPPAEIRYTSNICVNSVEAMTSFCLAGLGLATPPDFLVEEALASGTLREVFPEWQVDPIPLHALWLANSTDDRATRLLLNHLTTTGGAAKES